MADGNRLYYSFRNDAIPEIKRRLTGQRGTLFYTSLELRALAYSLAVPLFTQEGKDVKAEEYPHNRTFRVADTSGRYVFVLDQTPRNHVGDIPPQITNRYVRDARRMPAPAGVWIVALPERENQPVKVVDLLEELGATINGGGTQVRNEVAFPPTE